VAFQADLDDFVSSGVFTGPSAATDAVIRTGDTVGGNTVQSVSACREMLNARGQVAARVTFEDTSERSSGRPRSRSPGAPGLLAYRERMGWSFNWASSYGSDFNVEIGFRLAL